MRLISQYRSKISMGKRRALIRHHRRFPSTHRCFAMLCTLDFISKWYTRARGTRFIYRARRFRAAIKLIRTLQGKHEKHYWHVPSSCILRLWFISKEISQSFQLFILSIYRQIDTDEDFRIFKYFECAHIYIFFSIIIIQAALHVSIADWKYIISNQRYACQNYFLNTR